MSDGVISDAARHEHELDRLTHELRRALEQRALFELEVLNSRDHAIAQAAHIGELRHRLVKQAAMLEMRRNEFQIHSANYLAHIARLEAALAEATRTAAHAEGLRRELADVRGSATWNAGRAVMLPVRALKRLLRRG